MLARHEPITKFMIIRGLLLLASTILITVYEEHRGAKAEASTVMKPTSPL